MIDSDYDEEEELQENVGELPPKIEDLQVVEYDDNENDLTNEAPTVVIDSSFEDLPYYRDEYANSLDP